MLPELKICVVMVFLSAILLCSSNAIPINTRERDIDALQRIIGRLLSSRDFQDSLQDSRQVRDIEDLNLLERQRRGESPLRGVALVPIDSLRRQYEEERRRREHARMNARNQKYFASIG
ncbi:hypothetical protein BSL78_28735 [Apostichopus japonicus]|uniref:Uncharacterized protein n=1 Tax=Stichopus japonicus TaxID=307972 RepID=A0A2G8JFD3_STIJA|nr:hypothetical protein BSL78_28735 [Apostichopus japonicus]